MNSLISDHLIGQLADYTATTEDGEHLVMLDSGKRLHVSGLRFVSAQRASTYLQMGEWIQSTTTTCGLSNCVRPDHIAAPQPATSDPEEQDEELLSLVQRHSMSLASLYKKAKSRGLLPARSEYGHSV